MLLVGEAAMPDQSDVCTGVVPTRLLVLTWLPIVGMHTHPGEGPASCIPFGIPFYWSSIHFDLIH